MNECECSVNFNYSYVPLIFLTLYLVSKYSYIIVKKEFFNSLQKLKKKSKQNTLVHPFKSLEFQCI